MRNVWTYVDMCCFEWEHFHAHFSSTFLFHILLHYMNDVNINFKFPGCKIICVLWQWLRRAVDILFVLQSYVIFLQCEIRNIHRNYSCGLPIFAHITFFCLFYNVYGIETTLCAKTRYFFYNATWHIVAGYVYYSVSANFVYLE